MSPSDLPDRLARRIVVEPSGCWRWIGTRTPSGYGRVGFNGDRVYVHRLTYQLLVDPSFVLRPGRCSEPQIDHVAERCELHRPCVNPDHLEPVSIRTNVQRGLRNRYGFTGVDLTQAGRYSARIDTDGRHHYLGGYDSAADAGAAYDAACIALGETPANFTAGRLPSLPSRSLVVAMRSRIERTAAA